MAADGAVRPQALPRPADRAVAVGYDAPRLTDLGNAERFAAQHRKTARYCWLWRKWLIWDGRRWAVDPGDGVYALAKETVRRLYAEAAGTDDAEARKELLRHALKCESKVRISAMIELARSEPGIPAVPDELDSDPLLLNVRNGTIDLRTGRLRPHDYRDLITKLAPVDFTLNAPRPILEAFLEGITGGDRELMTYHQRLAGYSLTGDTTEQCLFLHYGSGANGKSTYLSALSYVLGDYARQCPPEALVIRRNPGIPSDIASLRGARLVVAQEVEDGKRLAESLVKQLTGGDKVATRFLYGEWFEFTPDCKIHIAANHRPRITGTDYAIWRRVRLIPYNVVFSESDRDPKMLDKLKAEGEGILAWMIEGCLAWQSEGLPNCPAVASATEEYRQEQDVIGDFLLDCCVDNPMCRTPVGELFNAYLDWCDRSGEEPLKKNTFGRKLSERGYRQVRTSTTRLWDCIGLLQSGGEDDGR